MGSCMMSSPLLLDEILERAATEFPNVEIVSQMPDKSRHRETYGDMAARAKKLAQALLDAGIQSGDRVGTLSWNHFAHLECYFGIPAMGGVCHMINIRLAPEDIAWIINHAEDRILVVDDVLLPLYEKFADQINVEKVVVVNLTGQAVAEPMIDYETFLDSASQDFVYPDKHEDDACGMCYTSGTTGRPKGVVRDNGGHAVAMHYSARAVYGLTPQDTFWTASDVDRALGILQGVFLILGLR